MTLPSAFDVESFKLSREFIDKSVSNFISHHLSVTDYILEIGGQGKYVDLLCSYSVASLDITPDTRPTFLGDITTTNTVIPANTFDAIICTDVLEHVVDPFAAVRELIRIMKLGGKLLITTPLNARIHGPIPDCWRFTEFGLRMLFRDLTILELTKLDTPGRNLFPLHYKVIVKKHEESFHESDPRLLKFRPVS